MHQLNSTYYYFLVYCAVIVDPLLIFQMNETLVGSSESGSISSTSFISAVSSQEENGLVNLHMQINRPIIEAPLLMSSYINHLSQVPIF